MNKEQQELLDEVYENYLNEWTFEKHPNDGSVYNVEPIKVKEHTKPQFEYRCKTDTEFSEKWGLTIEERELSLEERYDWFTKTYNKNLTRSTNQYDMEDILNTNNIPTKLITITYNDKTIESYE
jgi:hypothetical protein